MMATIKSKLEDICNSLKPGISECIIYGGSLPISAFCGLGTYIATKNLYYTAIATAAPQTFEYILFRAMEFGVFGKNVRNKAKNSKEI